MKSFPWGLPIAILGIIGLAAAGYAFRHPLYHTILLGEPVLPTEASPEAGAILLPASRNVSTVLHLCEPKTQAKFAPLCKANGIVYPPSRLRLLAFKEEKVLEVWGANKTGTFHKLATYPIRAASGHAGPKRHEGDRQVPEGFYRLTSLNPISHYHLSIRVDYPNADDIAANPDIPINHLGSDIYIHGKAASIGCLAMGDAAIEEIFSLAAQATQREVWISPVDPRQAKMPEVKDANLQERYARLCSKIQAM